MTPFQPEGWNSGGEPPYSVKRVLNRHQPFGYRQNPEPAMPLTHANINSDFKYIRTATQCVTQG